MNNYNEKLEKNLNNIEKQKEEADKRLLTLEVVIGVLTASIFLTLCFIAAYAEIAEWLRVLLIVVGLIPVLIACFFGIRIEQTAGYYECAKCHHKYVPTYSNVLWAQHFGRTRYMKCPKCNEKSWQKKVISK